MQHSSFLQSRNLTDSIKHIVSCAAAAATATAAAATQQAQPHPPVQQQPDSSASPMRSALSMDRSSSSRLGKVRKISLLGKGECRNRPHLRSQNSQQAVAADAANWRCGMTWHLTAGEGRVQEQPTPAAHNSNRAVTIHTRQSQRTQQTGEVARRMIFFDSLLPVALPTPCSANLCRTLG
jgi:hypothetical protein